MKSPACFVVSLAVLAAACGGNVLVDGPGSTSTSTSTTTGPTGVSLCMSACQAVNAACPDQMSSDCAATCNKLDPLFENACPQEYEAYMSCVAANAPLVCNGTAMACSSEIMALMPCLEKVCMPDPSMCGSM